MAYLPVLAQGNRLVGLQPKVAGRDCGRDQQSTTQRVGSKIALVGLSSVALEQPTTLLPHSLKPRVFHFTFKSTMTKKNICFVSIFDLTVVQFEMASRLLALGHHCFWITTDRRWTNWLNGKGIPNSHILELIFTREDFLEEDQKAVVLKRIVENEACSRRTVNMNLLGDRFVTAGDLDFINEYVFLYYYHIEQYLLKKQINIVFFEPTSAVEMLTALLCNSLKILCLYPQSLRFPSDMFFFELGIATGTMVSTKTVKNGQSGALNLSRLRDSLEQPKYFHLLQRSAFNFRKNLASAVRIARATFYPITSLTQLKLSSKLSNRVRVAFNRFFLRHLLYYTELENIHGKIAYFPLHVQPESSIDVMGPYYSDQMKLIKDILRSLPFDFTLVVKEHPNFLGQRGLPFFQTLRNLPNVRIVHPYTSTFDVLKRASLVFTVTGTTAFEAGMLGVPSIIFIKTFFSEMPNIYLCRDVEFLKLLITKILDKSILIDSSKNDDEMDHILQKSYQGYWTDPYSDPTVLHEDNISALFKGFIDVVENVDFESYKNDSY